MIHIVRRRRGVDSVQVWKSRMLHIIGIDCAAQTRDIGLALGIHEAGRTRIQELAGRLGESALLDRLERWIRAAPAACWPSTRHWAGRRPWASG